MYEKRFGEIEARKLEIRAMLEGNEEVNFEEIQTELRNLEAEEKQLRARLEVIKSLQGNGTATNMRTIETTNKEERNEEDVYASKEYRSFFLRNLQGKQVTEAEKRQYSLVPNTGGAVVPTATANMIFDNMVKIAPMLNEIQLLRVAGNLRFAVQGVRNAATPHAENAPIAPAADTMVTVTLTGFEFVKVIRISATIQTMAIDMFESWLTKILAEDLAVAVDNQIINGGTVSGSIAAAQVWVNGVNQVTYVANVAYNDLTNLIALLPSAFDANAKWLMNKAMFYQQVMQITDANGNLIAVSHLSEPGIYRILGYPVLIDDQVPAGEAFFGDYKQVVGNLSSDIKIDRSEASGFLNNSVDYRGTCIFDCDLAQPTAIVKLNV